MSDRSSASEVRSPVLRRRDLERKAACITATVALALTLSTFMVLLILGFEPALGAVIRLH